MQCKQPAASHSELRQLHTQIQTLCAATTLCRDSGSSAKYRNCKRIMMLHASPSTTPRTLTMNLGASHQRGLMRDPSETSTLRDDVLPLPESVCFEGC